MLTVLIIVALSALAYITINQIMSRSKSEESIDLSKTLLHETNIHEEIAKTVETLKTQEPVVIEAPFVAEKVKPKKKTTTKKTASKKPTAKTSAKKTTKK